MAASLHPRSPFLPILLASCFAHSGAPALAEDGASAYLEEVLVTARKREENLQRTPLSITAISAATIEDAHLPDIRSLEQMVPNLSFSTSSEGGAQTVQAFVRGIGSNDFALTLDPGVGIYVDGVYMARHVGSNLEFNDIEQVTVLRGPQGTLFGRNTIGGAIDVVTRAPSHQPGLDVTTTVGDGDFYGISAYGETSLVPDRLSASISFRANRYDGWQDRVGADDAGNEDLWGARAHLLWTPSETFSSHLVVDVTDQDQQVRPHVLEDFDPTQIFAALYNGFVATCCTANPDIDESNVTPRTKDVVETGGFSWNNTWELGGLTVKSITGYRDLESEQYRDSDNDPLGFFEVGTIFDHDQVSQEFIFSGTALDDRLDWVAGGYYFKEDGVHISEVHIADGLYEALRQLPLDITLFPGGPALAFLAVPFDFSLDYIREQEVTSYAAYFHGTYSLTDKLRLTLAGRYTEDEKDMTTSTLKRASQTPIVAPGPTDDPSCGDVVPDGNGSRYSCSDEWSEFSPKVGLDYQWNEDLMSYAHVSRGFRSGAFNARPLANHEISTADPETLTSYEIGFKSQFADNRVQLNGAIFYNEYEDQQFLVNRSSESAGGALALIVENAAESNLWGFELEMMAVPAEGWTINGGISYIEPEYDEFFVEAERPGNPGVLFMQDVSDREFTDTPDWTGNLGVQYEMPLSAGGLLRLRADMAYKGEIFYTFDRTASAYDTLNVDGYATYNAGVTYITADRRWEFSLYGRNISDERKISGGTVVDAFGSVDTRYTEPERYFLSVRYRTR